MFFCHHATTFPQDKPVLGWADWILMRTLHLHTVEMKTIKSWKGYSKPYWSDKGTKPAVKVQRDAWKLPLCSWAFCLGGRRDVQQGRWARVLCLPHSHPITPNLSFSLIRLGCWDSLVHHECPALVQHGMLVLRCTLKYCSHKRNIVQTNPFFFLLLMVF